MRRCIIHARKLRRLLYKQALIEADIVVGIPAAVGFSAESRIPLEMGLVKNKGIIRLRACL